MYYIKDSEKKQLCVRLQSKFQIKESKKNFQDKNAIFPWYFKFSVSTHQWKLEINGNGELFPRKL